jgi:hypothetical protein
MTQTELLTQFKTIGYPIAYHHFIVNDNNPHPTPPYIIYLRTFDNNISSDYAVHGKHKNYQVELYTIKKDLTAEQKVETVLNVIDTDYEASETYIESEGLYQVIYEIEIIERR